MMKVLSLLVLGFSLSLWTCSPHDPLEPPDNPLDPDNPVYVSPYAEVISGPVEGEVVDTTTVTFQWRGNESASEYKYQFDDTAWSEWGYATSTQFNYLDEGIHHFQVLSRSLNGEEQSGPTQIDFEVDAVLGPATLVYPYHQIASPGDTLVFQIMAEEVTDLFAVELNVTLSTEYLELIEVMDGDIIDEWGGEALKIQDVTGSSVSFFIVAVEGGVESFTGTTSILTLKAKVMPSFNLNTSVDVIELTNVVYLTPELGETPISTIRTGTLISE